MKKLVYFITIIAQTSILGCKNQPCPEVTISGNLGLPNDTIVLQKIDLDKIELSNIHSIITDSRGKFNSCFEIEEPTMAFMRLPDGTPIDLFLESDSKVSFDYKDGRVIFSKSNPLHTLLNDFNLEYYSLNAKYHSLKDANLRLDSILTSQLDKITRKNDNTSELFKSTLKYQITGLNYSKRLNYFQTQDSTEFTAGLQFLSSISFSDKTALLSKDYVNMLILALPYLLEAAGMENNAINSFQYLDKYIENIRYRKYAKSIYLIFNYGIIDKQEREQILSDFADSYANQIPGPIKGMLKMMPGNILTDFRLQDINSNKISLKQYTDKVILFDFWATWCGPCLREEPSIYELARQYPSDLVVLSLNLDESSSRWRSHISELPDLSNIIHINIDGGVNSPFAQSYFLTGPPRYILVGKNNKVIDAYAAPPSTLEFKQLLENHMKD